MNCVIVRAFAKINLYLRITGRRADGYHDLDTVLQSLTLHDTLEITAAEEGIHLEVDDPSIPAGPSNLVWRAAEGLPAPPGGPSGLRIRLVKRIPAGSGLGGGSSDAAAALMAIQRLRGATMAPADLLALAATLGSDVPYFLTGGLARVVGRGEVVHPLPDAGGYRLLVVHPGVPLSTGEVYARTAAALTPAPEIDSMFHFGRTFPHEVEALVRRGNDLEPAARGLCPVIGEVKDRLRDAGATAVSMTGSGSAIFGVFRGGAPLHRAARSMEQSGWRAFACEPLGRIDFHRGLSPA